MKLDDHINEMTMTLKEWSDENTCGTLMTVNNMRQLIYWVFPHSNEINIKDIDEAIVKYETESGFLVKSCDVKSLFKKYKFID